MTADQLNAALIATLAQSGRALTVRDLGTMLDLTIRPVADAVRQLERDGRIRRAYSQMTDDRLAAYFRATAPTCEVDRATARASRALLTEDQAAESPTR